MSNQSVSGDVHISTVSIFTDRGVVNLAEHVQGMSIFESIFTPGVIAEMLIWDTRNLSNLLPILGGERLLIEFNTPNREPLKYEMVVTTFREGTPAANQRSKSYILKATTPEVMRNQSMQVSKAYNTNISNMVSDLMEQHIMTEKRGIVQPTRGIQQLLIQSQRPFDAISMLRRRAVSVEDQSSSYVFFENRDGWHFRTIEKLFQNGRVGDRTFTANPTRATSIVEPDFRSIIAYEQPRQFDTVDRLRSGGMAQEVRKFDYKTLTYTRRIHQFDASQYRNADGSMRDPDSRELRTNYGRTAGTDVMVHHDSGLPDTFLSEGAGPRSGGTSILSQGSILLHVFGDSEASAGQLINLRILETTSETQAPRESTQLSGNYVISFIRHIIKPAGSAQRYTCSIEALKGGYRDKE